ncbi:MAG: LuxR family transcriptional regulator [Hyphomicrobiaceae bacterium]
MSRREIERWTLEFVENLEAIDDIDSIQNLFLKFIDKFGFFNAACLKVPEAGEDILGCLLMCSVPQGWVDQYARAEHQRFDPVLRGLFHTYQAYSWREAIERRPLAPRQQQVLDEAAEFGLRDGFVVPIYEASGYTGLVSLAGHQRTVRDELRNALTLACIYLHNKLSSVRRREADSALALTERELECLCWAAAGKSDWEIGQILTISAKTVNYHIENAKRKFGVATRVQAIVAALRTGKLVH